MGSYKKKFFSMSNLCSIKRQNSHSGAGAKPAWLFRLANETRKFGKRCGTTQSTRMNVPIRISCAVLPKIEHVVRKYCPSYDIACCVVFFFFSLSGEKKFILIDEGVKTYFFCFRECVELS